MSFVRTFIFVICLAVSLTLGSQASAGGAVHGGIGFGGGGFHGGIGFHGGFGGGHLGFGPGFGPGFGGVHGFFGGFHPGIVNPIFVGPGLNHGRLAYRSPYYSYGYGNQAYYRSSYNRYGWRKWYTYTDFSEINYPGVYPIQVQQPTAPRQPDRESQY